MRIISELFHVIKLKKKKLENRSLWFLFILTSFLHELQEKTLGDGRSCLINPALILIQISLNRFQYFFKQDTGNYRIKSPGNFSVKVRCLKKNYR